MVAGYVTILNLVYYLYTSRTSLQVYKLTLASNKTISLGSFKHSRGFAGKLKFIIEIFNIFQAAHTHAQTLLTPYITLSTRSYQLITMEIGNFAAFVG